MRDGAQMGRIKQALLKEHYTNVTCVSISPTHLRNHCRFHLNEHSQSHHIPESSCLAVFSRTRPAVTDCRT
jgi:hypothetical protein